MTRWLWVLALLAGCSPDTMKDREHGFLLIGPHGENIFMFQKDSKTWIVDIIDNNKLYIGKLSTRE